ncbi:hypothetical protein BU23DRAFT_601786 [Bimuria novae-zelandiae CBS 107.79]|uniref:Rhodopsin domain-containing protein n=1 Tax=Bimuria novae-zelandiae CBS 107.79 TaxID=1447943 RepID=A0A6A5UYV1_9PLEO|nr:hypothetical protein BU23DRAFT_601786 [Bimuria novae-zelandiae CBS 107.79]
MSSALQPPPTYINDSHKKWDTTIFIIVLLIIAATTTIARFILRWKSRTFGMDDWAMIPALAGYLAHSTLGVYVNARAGIGKPLWEVSIQEFELWLKGILLSCFLYALSSGLIRISILLFYDRVFSKTNRLMRLAIRITLAMTLVYIITFDIYASFLCKPLHKFWKPFERAQYCGDNIIKWIFDSAVYGYSLILDLVLLTLPAIPVLKLQLSTPKKIGVLVMFAMGASACIAATYKLIVFGLQWGRMGYIDPRWANQQLSLVIPPQFDSYGHTMWIPTQAELSAAIIGSSLIALKPYLQRSIQIITTALGDIVRTISSKSQAPKDSGQFPSHSPGGPVQIRSTDKYVRMDESSTALNEEFELGDPGQKRT